MPKRTNNKFNKHGYQQNHGHGHGHGHNQYQNQQQHHQRDSGKAYYAIFFRVTEQEALEILLQNKQKNLTFPGGKPQNNNNNNNNNFNNQNNSSGDDIMTALIHEQCNGGPYQMNLPPLKVLSSENTKHTVQYNCYFLSYNSGWNTWQPTPLSNISSSLNLSFDSNLILHNKSYMTMNGYCWVSIQDLREECITQLHFGADSSKLLCKFGANCNSLKNNTTCEFLHLPIDNTPRPQNGRPLHPGLIKWILSDYEKLDVTNVIGRLYTEQKSREDGSFIRSFQTPCLYYSDEVAKCELTSSEFTPDFKGRFAFTFTSNVTFPLDLKVNIIFHPNNNSVKCNMNTNDLKVLPQQMNRLEIAFEVTGPFSSKLSPILEINHFIPKEGSHPPSYMYWKQKKFQLPIHILKYHAYKPLNLEEFQSLWTRIGSQCQFKCYHQSFLSKLETLFKVLNLQPTQINQTSFISSSSIHNMITTLYIVEIDNNQQQIKITVTSESKEVTETMIDLIERLNNFTS